MKTANGTEYKYSREEQETIYRYDAVERMWHAWSNIPKEIERLKRQGWTLTKEDQYGAYFEAPSFALKIGKAYKAQLTDEEKARRMERLKTPRIQQKMEA